MAILIALISTGCSKSTATQAAELPGCDDPETKKVFTNVVNTWRVHEFKEIKGDDPKKRWCYVFYTGRYGLESPFMQAIFTLEWINESEGRFWLQVQNYAQTCRGVMHDPWSRERCRSRE